MAQGTSMHVIDVNEPGYPITHSASLLVQYNSNRASFNFLPVPITSETILDLAWPQHKVGDFQ
jgi:hypothetical protein